MASAMIFGRYARCSIYIGVIILILRTITLPTSTETSGWARSSGFDILHHGDRTHRKEIDLEFLSLNDHQCRAAFPALTKELDHAVSQGPFNLTHLKDTDHRPGQFQVRIEDGKLYILFINKHDHGEIQLIQRSAILHALHRALLTSPSRIPDTTLTLNANDEPLPTTVSFSRPTFRRPGVPAERNAHIYLMPHYASWSYAPTIATLDGALEAIAKLEGDMRFKEKKERAVWRGTLWFNPVVNKELRPMLLKVAAGKEWADVVRVEKVGGDREGKGEGEKSGDEKGGASTALGIEEFCGYKYVIYTEGVSYSGRLPFHMACRSVLVTPPLEFVLHTSQLLKPIYADELLGLNSEGGSSHVFGSGGKQFAHGDQLRHPGWNISYSLDEANVVFVRKDWSDLEQVVEWLKAHPEPAEKMATRLRRETAEQGYFSAAAEACYWRMLIRSWAEMVRFDRDADEWQKIQNKKGWGGTRWEVFSVTGEMEKRKV